MKMKRIILAALVMVLAFALMPVKAEAAAKPELSDSTISLPAGGKWQLYLNNAPEGKKVTWSSSDKKVADVSKKGKVTAKKIGTAKVTAKVKGKKYTCTVNVIKPNDSDVKALKKIIKAQKKAGAKVPSKMNSSSYMWDGNGRLTGIYWDNCKLKGSISFAELKELSIVNCVSNKLSKLDVSKNTKLEQLDCTSNQLSKLDVSKNKKLVILSCVSNQLSELDVSKNTKLLYLYCGENQLSKLDVSKNKKLMNLFCNTNQLSSLNVSNNTMLNYIDCSSNQLSTLDVSKNTKLMWLSCSSNQLSQLDVSKNTKLESLYCNDNKITTLDLSSNTALINVGCDDTVEVIGYNK